MELEGGWFDQSQDEPRISRVRRGPADLNGHAHQLAIERPKVQLVSFLAPLRITAAVGGHAPPRCRVWKRLDVHFVASRFVRREDNPLAVWRKLPLDFRGRR